MSRIAIAMQILHCDTIGSPANKVQIFSKLAIQSSRGLGLVSLVLEWQK
jgi:hypothetical protein